MFLTFEGIEGSGKSTQIRLFADALKARGLEVVLTREPGGTAIADRIRAVLLDPSNAHMVPQCEVLLYWAARAQHVAELILPALERGAIVLCDRFVDSTIAYQGYARGLPMSEIQTLHKMVCGSLKVDKTFLMDLPAADGLARAKSRNTDQDLGSEARFELEALAFHEKVRNGFLALATNEPKRFAMFDATKPRDVLHKQVLQVFDDLNAGAKS